MQGYIIASYVVITDSYTAGDNQLHAWQDDNTTAWTSQDLLQKIFSHE